MRYLLDTNVLSELRKEERANAGVFNWAVSNDPALCALSVVTVCEIRKGIEEKRRSDVSQARTLEIWFASVLQEFSANILPITVEIAERWGIFLAASRASERDTMIAATALEHDLTIVTRNVSDFEGTGARIVNPWK